MNLLLWLIVSGVVGTLVFATLVLFRPATEKLFSKTWHYYSLCVPLFFMLGGTLFTGAFSTLANQIQSTTVRDSSLTSSISTQVMPSQNPFHVPFSQVSAELENAKIPYYSTIATELTSSSPVAGVTVQLLRHIGNISHVLIAAWVVGVVLFMYINIKKYLQYRHLVLLNAAWFEAVSNDTKRYQVSAHAAMCKIPIAISSYAHTPMLIGIVKPTIVLPTMHFDGAQFEAILSHELVHHKRKDLLLKLVVLVANAIHWYNPVAYTLNNQLNTFCELSCDEVVVSEMDTDGKRLYGETILHVLEHSTTQKRLAGNLMFATNLCNSKNNIKRRLFSMMNTSKKMKKSIAALALAVGIFAVGGGFFISHMMNLAMPVYAAEADYTAEAEHTSKADDALAPNLADETIENAETINEPTQPVIYQGNVVGAETTKYAEDVIVEAAPFIFDNINEMLEVIYQEMGNIMFPTYLPEGFVLSEIGTMHPIDFTQHPELFTDGCYAHLNTLSAVFSNGEEIITLTIAYFQPYTRDIEGSRNLRRLTVDDLSTLNDFGQRHVTVSGMNATICHYTGLILYDINSGLAHRFSDVANAAASYDGVRYQFLPDLDSNLTDDDLIRIAESLVHVVDLMQ